MLSYIIRRLFLIVPTLLGIMIVNFIVIQLAPGGPVERVLAEIQGTAVDATARITGNEGSEVSSGQQQRQSVGDNAVTSKYRGAQGLDPAFIRQLEKQFGFDKPPHERFFAMLGNYLTFDFGKSFFRDKDVVGLILEKMPVSISIGVWSTLIIYLISIPLGVAKAVRDGSRFDIWTSGAVIFGNAIPGFLFAILLIVVFAGGRYLDWFPLRGLVSDDWDSLSWPMRIVDYFWHMALPILSLVIGGFARLTMLTKNSFLDQIGQQYVVTARSKGLGERQVLYGHVFRNAMLILACSDLRRRSIAIIR
jgi:microcin C transport system permease protein